MRRQSCLGRLFVALAWLIGLAVLAAAGCYAAAARVCLAQQPTDSKLFDEFAGRVKAKQGWRLYGGLGATGVLLEPDAVAAWEPRYKDEPQYWQLRYWLGCASYAARNAKPPAPPPQAPAKPQPAGSGTPGSVGGSEPPDVSAQRQEQNVPGRMPRELLAPLRQAVDAGSADEATLLLLYEGEMAAQDPAAKVAEREPLLKLLDQAIYYDPQHSWGYYLRALHRLDVLKGERVDWELVRADLAAGNKAKRNARPLAFPHGFVEDQIAHKGQAAGGPVLAGAVLDHGALVQAQIPLAEMVARATRIGLAHCIETGDFALAGELQRALCRIAAVDETNPDEKLALAGPLRMVAYYMGVRLPYPRTWQQQEDSYQVQQWLNDAPFIARLIRTEVEAQRLARLAPYAWLDPGPRQSVQFIDSTSDADLRALEPGRVPAWVRYSAAYELRLAEREQLYDRFQRLLAGLHRFDLERMQLPYDLSPVNRPRRLPPVIPTVEQLLEMQKQQQAAEASGGAPAKAQP